MLLKHMEARIQASPPYCLLTVLHPLPQVFINHVSCRLSLPYEGSDPLGAFPPQPCTLEMSLKAVNYPRAIKAGERVAADPTQQQQQKLFDPPLGSQRSSLVLRVAEEMRAKTLVDAGEYWCTGKHAYSNREWLFTVVSADVDWAHFWACKQYCCHVRCYNRIANLAFEAASHLLQCC